VFAKSFIFQLNLHFFILTNNLKTKLKKIYQKKIYQKQIQYFQHQKELIKRIFYLKKSCYHLL